MRLKAVSPSLERSVMNHWYQFVAARFQQPDWTFMNFGYAGPEDEPGLELSAHEEPDRCCIQLYHHTADPTSPSGKDVLEVGSGRGGGAAWLARYYGPQTLTGIDLCTSAVKLSNRLHRFPGLTFRQGSALAMPFADNSFDVVVNVESSHGYGNMDRFLAEVGRVLRPGGLFAWADFRPADRIARLEQSFAASGLEPLRIIDITAHVLRSLDRMREQRLDLIRRHAPRLVWGLLREFAAVAGSDSHRQLAAGRLVYLSATLQK
uniref:Class I SAM-dependent methyltransferase n=1 Tax=candidate division WOR-3 bacterium TaxID=2052148 RepID=A0A7C4CES8_UNCW3